MGESARVVSINSRNGAATPKTGRGSSEPLPVSVWEAHNWPGEPGWWVSRFADKFHRGMDQFATATLWIGTPLVTAALIKMAGQMLGWWK
jgi:hypothetical protein